jgi:hypothetical protein
MTRPNRVRAVAGALVLVAGLGALAGCGDEESGAAADADRPSVSSDGGSPAGSTGPGDSGEDTGAAGDTATPSTGIEGLPEGFPSQDVPLLPEKVLTGSAGGPDGEFAWSVVLQSSRSVGAVSADVRQEFSDAGYTAGPGNEVGDLSVMKFSGPKYEVGVTAARTEGNVVITYVVRDLVG